MDRQKVLLIEDCLMTQALVRAALADVCDVLGVEQGAHALSLLKDHSFDLILLDIELPDGEGFELYGQIRKQKNYVRTPIIFLTGRSQVEHKVRAFAMGAEDYVVKPFDLVEFRARVAAKLKNSNQITPADSQTIGPFHIRLSTQKIALQTRSGLLDLELTSNQFKILYFLLSHEGQVISREQLIKEIWGEDSQVSDRTIDSHIYSIRQQIGDASKLLQSVHRQGYRFSGEVGGDLSA